MLRLFSAKKDRRRKENVLESSLSFIVSSWFLRLRCSRYALGRKFQIRYLFTMGEREK
jgi:hypothetical protein